jgi:hypothetical protein
MIVRRCSDVTNVCILETLVKTKKPIAIKDSNDGQELGYFVLVHNENTRAGEIIATIETYEST